MNKLFKRDFTMVVVGQIISLFGSAILRFALPLYLLRETDSSSLFGAVTACSFIPMVIFSLFGGVIADRKNKRNIMVVLDFTTAAVILIFSFALGKISLVPLMIAVLMILYGISGIYQPAVQESIPLIAEKQFLMQGNAVINMVSTLAGLLGPYAEQRGDKYGKHSRGSAGTDNRRRSVRRLRNNAYSVYKRRLFCIFGGHGNFHTYTF